jgi:hypothetical protein
MDSFNKSWTLRTNSKLILQDMHIWSCMHEMLLACRQLSQHCSFLLILFIFYLMRHTYHHWTDSTNMMMPAGLHQCCHLPCVWMGRWAQKEAAAVTGRHQQLLIMLMTPPAAGLQVLYRRFPVDCNDEPCRAPNIAGLQ